jgi:sulfotransferase family protein
MSQGFRLLMLGAMYENGGNVTHRLLDGHPQLFVYPFESQLGTSLVLDPMTSMFPIKYRWPVFALDATPAEDYRSIIDEECRVRARTPHVSKFRHVAFDFSDDDRRHRYLAHVKETGRSRGNNVAAFFRATFEAWKDFRASGRETMYVGYSPIVTVDADKILRDLPDAHVVHVVRNPWSAYADTKKRPVPLSLANYMLAWSVTQHHALVNRELFPGRLHVVRAEDVMADPHRALGVLCQTLELEPAESLRAPSWNGLALDEVYPWGTIRRPTSAENRATAERLTADEQAEVRCRAGRFLESFDYKQFLPG